MCSIVGVVKENQNPLISREYGLVQSILNKLSPCTLIRVKANLTTPATNMDNPIKTLHNDSLIKTGITEFIMSMIMMVRLFSKMVVVR